MTHPTNCQLRWEPACTRLCGGDRCTANERAYKSNVSTASDTAGDHQPDKKDTTVEHQPADPNCVRHSCIKGCPNNHLGECRICICYDSATWLTQREAFIAGHR